MTSARSILRHSGPRRTAQLPEGVLLVPAYLSPERQALIVQEVLALVEEAGWLQPVMPRSGRPYSVRMCNLGPLGWVSDKAGYRYTSHHPVSGRPWPTMPAALLAIWQALADCPAPPECCLVNLYQGAARMGLHQDRDEAEPRAPVLSLSLGDRALFRLGGLERRGSTRSFLLESGDALRLGGPSRFAFHGIDRIEPGSSALLPCGGRLNLTMRRVTPYA